MIRTFKDAGYKVKSAFEDGVMELVFPIDPTDTAIGVMRGREHRAEAVPTPGGCATTAGHIAQAFAGYETADRAVVEGGDDGAVGFDHESGDLALLELFLCAFDEAHIRQRREGGRCEREQIGASGGQVGAAHGDRRPRTASATKPASWPGVIAPMVAPTSTRRRARSLS